MSWEKICFPQTEGGKGFRDLCDVSKAMFAKLWWVFRTTRFFWTDYIWNKYCKKLIPIIVQWKSETQVWRNMLEARDAIEQEIWWEPTVGSSNIQFDKWSRIGALDHVVDSNFPINENEGDIDKLMIGDRWDAQKIKWILPSDIIQHIVENITISQKASLWDLPQWIPTTNKKFTVSSACQLLRHMSGGTMEVHMV